MTPTYTSTAARLARRAIVLDIIDRKREECGGCGIGAAIEKRLLDEELWDLLVATAVDVVDREIRAVIAAAKA